MNEYQERSGAAPAATTDPVTWTRGEIDAAIAGLDRAARTFSERVDALRATPPAAPVPRFASPEPAPRPAPEPEPAPRAAITPPAGPAPSRPDTGSIDRSGRIDFEAQMRDAERAASAYLEQAKRRADSLVSTMIGAVEREAADIKRDAEVGIRERWRQVEAEASGYLDQAKRVADGMVAERQHRIGALSDGICERADALTNGMDDAAAIRRQFAEFLRALSRTADEIAGSPQANAQHDRAAPRNHRQSRDTIAA